MDTKAIREGQQAAGGRKLGLTKVLGQRRDGGRRLNLRMGGRVVNRAV